ncbi:MAN1A2 [Bugula neritina]|uniref:alpha-1,2-Mannosidase n=1 Tax=Bugula neritina TaxID=10212 RepID=A0A7J7KQ75_BUGNE|nr:MAN1A2 [Bugula neritina]
MMVHAWTGYKKHAWGANELAPISGNPHSGIFSGTRIGLTIVDSLDTLYTMGLFEEVQLGKMWLKENLTSHLNVSVQVSVFEFNIRFVGGLLSMFALTNECEYRDLAVLCADKLLPAFETPHGIPVAHIDLKHGLNTRFTNFGNAILSEFGTLHLEFFYLSHITGEFKYRNLVENIREKVTKANVNGLYGNHFSINTAKYMSSNLAVSLGGAGDSFYEYLFKSYLQSGKTDTHALKLYFDAMEAIIKEGLLQTSGGGLRYFGMKHTGLSHNAQRRMEHLACFIGGVIGLSAEYSKNQTATLQLAEDIASTCHESYVRAASGIGPESFEFDTSKGDAVSAGGDSGYHMRPEVVETWFFLSRVTKDRKYREWCWDFIKALDKYCKVKDGYVGLHDVYLRRTDSKGEPLKEDVQQSYFMAETLKYLYLIYKDESLLSLDSWVFNTEAHPLPVLHPFL